MVKLLIENGAFVNVRDSDDQTPLYWTAEEGINLIIKIELKFINTSFFSGHVVSAKMLIENGAKINIRDTNSSTPLHTAVQNGKCSFSFRAEPVQLVQSPIQSI